VITTITLNGQSVNLVSLPACPGFKSYSIDMSDSVALSSSPFTGQTQAQQWLGADMWSGSMTPPSLDATQGPEWRAFLAGMRGMLNAVQLPDPAYQGPQGNPLGAPAIPGTVTDAAGAQFVHTSGWQPNAQGLLLPGDYMQIGYRLHMVLYAPVNADSSGNALIPIYPSLREAPTASAALILDNPMGLFRLGKNKRGWSGDFTRFTEMTIPIMEYR
jgi:hypothetical protein